MRKISKYYILLLLCFGYSNLVAQVSVGRDNNGDIDVTIYKGLSKQESKMINDTHKMVLEIKQEQYRQDSIHQAEKMENERKMALIDSTNTIERQKLQQEIQRKDSIYQAQTKYYEREMKKLNDQINNILLKLVHPYGIKFITMKKSTWRWVCNSVGVAGVGSGIGFCIAANNNHANYNNNVAQTLTEHNRYRKNAETYQGVAIGSFVVAGVAFLSNMLCSQVKNDIRFAPAVTTDPQGNPTAGLSMNIKF
jgi:hypothetical protein